MRIPERLWLISALLILLAGLLLPRPAESQHADPDIAVVVNSDNLVNNLTLPELRKIFRGERQYWSTGEPVLLLVRAPVARERNVMLRVVYQMAEEQYTQYWVGKVMRAEATTPPAQLFSNGITNEGVAGNHGAIAFISAAEVKPKVKVLRIDGHLPGEPGYPLR